MVSETMERKIIVIYIDSLNALGGIERIVYQLIGNWSKKYNIIVITKDSGACSYGELKEVKILSLDCPRIMNMKNRIQRIIFTFINAIISMFRLHKKLRQLEYSKFYVVTPINALEAYWAGVKADKLVISEHGSAYGVNRIYALIKKYIYPKASYISVPNRMDISLYENIGANAVYIPHIVYTKGKEQNTLDSKIILNCGRLTADKRQDDLIKIWHNVRNKNGWKLYIVGKGEEKENLERMIVEYNLCDSVKMLSATKDIEKIYKTASFFAFTSRFEGFGLVLVEAMSYGIPCIAFDCPSGPRDIIINKKNGYLVDDGDLELYTNILTSIVMMSPEELRIYGKNAYESIQEWDNEAILKEWDKVFGKEDYS